MAADKSVFRRLNAGGVAPLAARLALGGLFVYAGLVKVGNPIDFLKQLHEYHVLPESPPIVINSVAIVLPWLEVIAGAALILGAYVRGAAAAIAIMFVAFTPAIFLRALVIRATEGTPFFEIAFDCGCGTGVEIAWRKLVANGGLFLLSAFVLFSRSPRIGLGSWLEHRRAAPGCC